MSPNERGGAAESVRLGPLETQVMEVLWDGTPVTIREIITALAHEPAYTTIATVLTNLDRKSMVRSSKDGRATRYTATHSREQHAAGMMRQALATSPDRATWMLHFVQTMGEQDLDLLREYLARQEHDS